MSKVYRNVTNPAVVFTPLSGYLKITSNDRRDYFRYKGKRINLDWLDPISYPIMLKDEDGKLIVIGYYNAGLLFERHPDGEMIRVWSEQEFQKPEIDFEKLLSRAEEMIQEALSKRYEIDDCGYGQDALQVCVIDTNNREYTPVDEFYFTQHRYETEEELMQRFNERITDFTEKWRNIK
jgi:hypothetical protein